MSLFDIPSILFIAERRFGNRTLQHTHANLHIGYIFFFINVNLLSHLYNILLMNRGVKIHNYCIICIVKGHGCENLREIRSDHYEIHEKVGYNDYEIGLTNHTWS